MNFYLAQAQQWSPLSSCRPCSTTRTESDFNMGPLGDTNHT